MNKDMNLNTTQHI